MLSMFIVKPEQKKIDELQREVERLKVFEEYCENMKELKT